MAIESGHPVADIFIDIREDDFSVAEEYAAIRQSAGIGAVALFVGVARDYESPVESPVELPVNVQCDSLEGGVINSGSDATENVSMHQKPLLALQLEHYPGMVEKSIKKICEEAQCRWRLTACRVIHRVGTIAANEQIVLVATASAHRRAAFASCEYIMDYLKSEAPFWKKAVFADGSHWVSAKKSDSSALEKWSSDEN